MVGLYAFKASSLSICLIFKTESPAKLTFLSWKKSSAVVLWFEKTVSIFDYLFTAAVVLIASNLTGLEHLPVLIYSGMAYLKPPFFYLISCIPIAKK